MVEIQIHRCCLRQIANWLLFPLLLAWCHQAAAAGEKTFASPEVAVQALATATVSHDTNALHAIFGPEGHQLVSPDAVQASAEFAQFVARIQSKTSLATNATGTLSLLIGPDAWPFPIPLAERDGQWYFDTAAGREEILLHVASGRMSSGRSPFAARTCRRSGDTASEDRVGDGVLAYAQHLHSTTGQHDGLFWPAQAGDPLSPLDPLVGARGWKATAMPPGC